MNSSRFRCAFGRSHFNNTARFSFAALLLLSALSQNVFAEGLGTEAAPYLIPDAASLKNPLDSGYYEVTGSNLTFNGNYSPLYVGQTTSGNSLTIDGRGNGFTAYPGFCLGEGAGSEGTLNVTGATTVQTWALNVGWSGSGTLNITNGAKMQSSGGGSDCIAGTTLASSPSGRGKVVISGSGSKLTTANEFEIGHFGTGTVEVTGGGAFEASQYAVYLGSNRSNATGPTNNVVTVSGHDASGNSSAFIGASTLYLGWGNQGTFVLSDGGLAKLGALSINGQGEGFGILYMKGGYLAVASNLSDATINTILGYTRVGDSSSYQGAVRNSNIYVTYFASGSGRMIGGYDVSNYTVFSTTEMAVPEPATYAFFGGLGALGLVILKKKRR
jgi:T5SS/PEP-CTERM-associated repeat protein